MKINMGSNIRELRKRNNITQERLAEYLGVTYQTVSKWENGTSLPSISLLPSIANIFNISIDEVIAFIGVHTGLAFEYSGAIARIIALAVKKEYQRQGIGTKLLQTAESYFKENQVELIAVNSGIDRVEAHRFYEKQGFYKKGYSFTRTVF